jgi:hypothetical protein
VSAYEVLKDFAGPVATMFASVAAAYFAYAQLRIAREKLRLEMYPELRKIYEATKELITMVANATNIDRMDSSKIRSLYVTLDEGRFYFDHKLRSKLDDIAKLCEEYFMGLAKSDEAARSDRVLPPAQAERMVEITSTLRQIYADLPKTFEPTLKFNL